ncbi:hypothetical protein [Terriglobus sp. TAA 43]|uniref:hypothetical protein n=1 Tax=Terriglobus sp. TAA 43 TaxID=278961 RepID=UPI000648DB98|nr:hypothetical protein [Terriglobus sp. TAA 43]
MAFPTLNSIPSNRHSKSSKLRRRSKKLTPSLATVDIDSSLIAEVEAYCHVTEASLRDSINEAVSDWLQTSALSRLEYFVAKKNAIAMPSMETVLLGHSLQ